jgi:hypothetical protein
MVTVRNSRRAVPAAYGPCIDRSWTPDSPAVFPSVMPEPLSNRGCNMTTRLAQDVTGQPP